MSVRSLLALAATLALTATSNAQEESARLLRFPHIQADKIAFVYGGDLWTASIDGGAARRQVPLGLDREVMPTRHEDGCHLLASLSASSRRCCWV